MSLKPTPIVRIQLGGEWPTAARAHQAGDVVEVDALRGAWLLENVKGSALVLRDSAPELIAEIAARDAALIDLDAGATSPEEPPFESRGPLSEKRFRQAFEMFDQYSEE